MRKKYTMLNVMPVMFALFCVVEIVLILLYLLIDSFFGSIGVVLSAIVINFVTTYFLTKNFIKHVDD